MGSSPSQQSGSPDAGQSSSASKNPCPYPANIRAGEIIALRAWRVRAGNRLFSIFYDQWEWFPGQPLETSDNLIANEIAWMTSPGIHAFKHQSDLDNYLSWVWDSGISIIENGEYDKIAKTVGVVWGEVELWGTVWEHTLGYRAQFGRPLSLKGFQGKVDLKALQERFKRLPRDVLYGPLGGSLS